MSRLGRALGEIAGEISKNYGGYLGLGLDPNYTNSGDVLTELRNIRKMLTRASGGGNMLPPLGSKVAGLDNGGVIEELEALAMLFKSGLVTIDIETGNIFPIDINDFTISVFSKTATVSMDSQEIMIEESERFSMPDGSLDAYHMLLKITRPDGNIENHILQYTEPVFEGSPTFKSTTDEHVFLNLRNMGSGMFVPYYFGLGIGSGARPEGEYTVEVYYRPIPEGESGDIGVLH